MDTKQQDEQRHISAIVEGSKESFKWLFDQYKMPVYTYILSLLKSEKWADDVCSEVFLAIWKNRSHLRPETIQSYIFQIAKHKTFNRLKKVAADTQQEREYFRRYLSQASLYIDETSKDSNQEKLLMEAISNLPAKRKEILERKYYKGQRIQQIAQEMGIAKHTVKVQLYKARLFLKARLGGNTRLW